MKKVLFLMLVTLAFASCQDKNETHELDGKWNLKSISCLCEPIELESGKHVWNFNVNGGKVEIKNNTTATLHTVPNTGTYDIEVQERTVTLEGVVYDYKIESDTLILENAPDVDGPHITLVR